MRSLVYAVAILAAAGIMYSIATTPKISRSDESPAKASADTAVPIPVRTVAINVPDMECQFACFPHIKSTLEDIEAVTEVELAKQAVEGTLDNRQVIMTYHEGFDPSSILALLAAEGFENSEVVQ